VESIEDPDLAKYMNEFHPRFYELASIYGSPLDLISLHKEGKNISQTSAQVELVSYAPVTEGKTMKKKLLLSMSVTNLKAMCSKLFKINLLNMKIVYRGPEDVIDYDLDEEARQLSYYSVGEGGVFKIYEV